MNYTEVVQLLIALYALISLVYGREVRQLIQTDRSLRYAIAFTGVLSVMSNLTHCLVLMTVFVILDHSRDG